MTGIEEVGNLNNAEIKTDCCHGETVGLAQEEG
jgi:hypothetical protein